MSTDGNDPVTNKDENLIEFESSAVDDAADEGDDVEELTELETTVMVPSTVEDPVRMYLREIGRVALLEPQQEMWLSTVRAAAVIFSDTRSALEEKLDRSPTYVEMWQQLVGDARSTWREVEKLVKQHSRIEPPDLTAILDEAQTLRRITGQYFGYKPQALQGSGLGTTEERRMSSIKQWFAWWYRKGARFEKKVVEDGLEGLIELTEKEKRWLERNE